MTARSSRRGYRSLRSWVLPILVLVSAPGLGCSSDAESSGENAGASAGASASQAGASSGAGATSGAGAAGSTAGHAGHAGDPASSGAAGDGATNGTAGSNTSGSAGGSTTSGSSGMGNTGGTGGSAGNGASGTAGNAGNAGTGEGGNAGMSGDGGNGGDGGMGGSGGEGGAAGSGPAGSTSAGGSSSSAGGSDQGATWKQASLTTFESYPDPGSEECVEYNGCMWEGQFAAVDGVMPESWVMAHNIVAVHSNAFNQYKLKTLRLRKDGHEIDVTVYDECSDSDCDGCCTQNAQPSGNLLDVEKYTAQRFGVEMDGQVEWRCLDCD